MPWRDTEGAPNLPYGAQGNFCKEVASQLRLQEEEELEKKGQKLFQEQNGTWRTWGLSAQFARRNCSKRWEMMAREIRQEPDPEGHCHPR